ncbi:hypothetical protein GCM10027570_38430 [Streptomonospora sediminis]
MDDILLGAGIAAVVLAGFALGFYRLQVRRKYQRSPASPLTRPLPAAVRAKAQQRIDEGKPVAAIRDIRMATGYDLRAAQAVVDALSAGKPVPAADSD